jgi:hypothetical protein
MTNQVVSFVFFVCFFKIDQNDKWKEMEGTSKTFFGVRQNKFIQFPVSKTKCFKIHKQIFKYIYLYFFFIFEILKRACFFDIKRS